MNRPSHPPLATKALLVLLTVALVPALRLSATPVGNGNETLEAQFQNPPLSAGPHVYWFWKGTNISKEGITKDLESMQASGVGGALIMHVWGMMGKSPWPERTYRSEYYWEALKHAAAEADRLGMKISLTNGPGYTGTGGPWIDPKRNMRKLAWSVVKCEGPPAEVELSLPTPGQETPGVKAMPGAKFYEDIAVLAVPDEKNIRLEQVVDLSGKLQADGKLAWKKPEGPWVVYRIGMLPTMAKPHPIDGSFGNAFEVDKLSLEDNIYHWEKGLLEPLKSHLGRYFGTSFNGLHVDSYEVGMQNWTGTFREVFLKRKGYDPLPWLASFGPPVLGWPADKQTGSMTTGLPRNELSKFIDSEEKTLRFEWDFRENVSRMWNDCFIAAKRLMKENNFVFSYEPYAGPFNAIEGAAMADLSMPVFWLSSKQTGEEMHGGSISGARAGQSRLVGAEAFTAGPDQSRWTESPADFKFQGDGAFGTGVNRFVYHHWVHQPFDDQYQPGMGFSHFGTHFGRFQTWYEPGKAYFKYVQRSQFLLQQGEQVVDCLSLDGATKGVLCDTISAYDFLNDPTKVEDGQILLGSGRRYYYLCIPESEKMLPEVAEKLLSLAQAGAILVAPTKPTQSPSLKDYPECDRKVEAVARDLWDSGRYAGKLFKTVGEAVKAIGLEPDFIAPKQLLVLHRRAPGLDIYFVANRTSGPLHERVSFRVSGRQPELWNAEDGSVIDLPIWEQANGRTNVQLDLGPKQSVFVVFRQKAEERVRPTAVTAKHSNTDWWHVTTAADGKPVLWATGDGNLEVNYSDGKTRQIQIAGTKQTPMAGAWQVAFTPKLGAPFELDLPELVDFSLHKDDRVRFFSGTAVYRKEVQIPKLAEDEGLVLDLGQVHALASVRINGGESTVLWYPPYRLDIGRQLKAGRNVIEVAVTNTWANAIIGDERIPADFPTKKNYSGHQMTEFPSWFVKNESRPSGRKTFTFPANYYSPESEPQPAGLIGPVRLVLQKKATL